MSEVTRPRNLSGDLSAGHFTATSTVIAGRRNLFDLSEKGGHHIGTLISGSKTQHQRFDEDCEKIVRGLHALEVHDEILGALKGAAAFVREHYAPALDPEFELMKRIETALANAEAPHA